MRILSSLRIIFLVIALIGVIFVMRRLDSRSTGQFLQALGIDDGVNAAGGVKSTPSDVHSEVVSIEICPTRIRAFQWPDGRKLEESEQRMKTRWMSLKTAPGEKSAAEEINSIDVEKWLSLHCRVQAVLFRPSKDAPIAPAEMSFAKQLDFEFVDGKQAALLRAGPDLFKFGGQVFRSKDLNDALVELNQIAKFNKAAKGS